MNIEILEVCKHIFLVMHTLMELYVAWQIQNTSAYNPEEEIPLWGMPRPFVIEETQMSEPQILEVKSNDNGKFDIEGEPQTVESNYEQSIIKKEHGKFFEHLVASFESEDCSKHPYVEVSSFEEEILRMEDWNEPEPKPVLPEVSTPTKISDHVLGKQTWIVQVVGEEQGYLHVSDGTGRAWVYAGEIGTFIKGDILSMEVEREVEHIKAISIEILQRPSLDFIIPDECEEWEAA